MDNYCNKYALSVLQDLQEFPYFERRGVVIHYEIPEEGRKLDQIIISNKVIAVFNLKNAGAFEINSHEILVSKHVFSLKIQHEAFKDIHERCKNELLSPEIISINDCLIDLPNTKTYERIRKLAKLYNLKKSYDYPHIAFKLGFIKTLKDYDRKKHKENINNRKRSFNRLIGNKIKKELKTKNGWLYLE